MSARICIIGTGYVGMATAVGLAELGATVTGYDILPDRIDRLQRGITPYQEAGIGTALCAHVASGALTFHQSLYDAANDADIIAITVGTPARDDGSADLRGLFACIADVSALPSRKRTVVIRSTVPAGTSDAIAERLGDRANVLYAPEFLREGSALGDFLHPDRIVVGAARVADATPYTQLFESLGAPVIITGRCNAELIKGCSNAFLALKISFANQVANLCDGVGGDALDVLRGVGYDQRIGPHFLHPGIGFGGPCFEKDVKSLIHLAQLAGTGDDVFQATMRVNERQPQRVLSMLEELVGDLAGVTVGVWGLAFKAGTDDIRDSVAMLVVRALAERGVRLRIYDPGVAVAPLPENAALVATAQEAAEADALLVLTEWPEFSAIAPATVASGIRRKIVIDGRNILDPERWEVAGLQYRGVGSSGTSRIPAILTDAWAPAV